jgi:uncharacterized protein
MFMQDHDFEWDDVKAKLNFAKHGVHFKTARDVFRDPFAVEEIDDREDYGEDRFTIVGMGRERLLFVAYTMRGEAVRIISARGAEPNEERDYYEQNIQG